MNMSGENETDGSEKVGLITWKTKEVGDRKLTSFLMSFIKTDN